MPPDVSKTPSEAFQKSRTDRRLAAPPLPAFPLPIPTSQDLKKKDLYTSLRHRFDPPLAGGCGPTHSEFEWGVRVGLHEERQSQKWTCQVQACLGPPLSPAPSRVTPLALTAPPSSPRAVTNDDAANANVVTNVRDVPVVHVTRKPPHAVNEDFGDVGGEVYLHFDHRRHCSFGGNGQQTPYSFPTVTRTDEANPNAGTNGRNLRCLQPINHRPTFYPSHPPMFPRL
ncbi:hypothetical protein GALMADRAFT_162464 [Galerina marginata CBS 339.88]|uniref:Uncharacterized protein n=1 Tax=Galerina marginata (strain CBS 339.88) TaxID=685588 RepID=A0A067S2X4_GALM3|nr:hypothetical protein GALMADRAFT_162464 [Galerina marginata CBS 339.88]